LAPACLICVDVASLARAGPAIRTLFSVCPVVYATDGVHETSGGARRAVGVAVVDVCKQQGREGSQQCTQVRRMQRGSKMGDSRQGGGFKRVHTRGPQPLRCVVCPMSLVWLSKGRVRQGPDPVK
jgi:hypothetical protein